ncbi:Copia protein [Sesbania bispinosa]|nr:Copia protein [Sesbania bispinosa]
MVNSASCTQSLEASSSKTPIKEQQETKDTLTIDQYEQLIDLLKKSNSNDQGHSIGQM